MNRKVLSATCAAIALGLGLAALVCGPVGADDPKPAALLVSEVREHFTVGGKPIPPEIFRDFGDGTLADSQSIWVTVDVRAAVDSNLYADDITRNGDWIVQRQPAPATLNGARESAYRYIGAAANGLLVVLSSYSGGGTGQFVTLHILDIEAAPAFDSSGGLYDRLNLTNLRSVPLGDRWDGEIQVTHNAIRVVTTRRGPSDRSGSREEMTIQARRP
jgi:hypothetical protein